MRLIEIRLLDGPNLYRLEPAVRIELALGRRRSWYGQRMPARHGIVRLSATVRPGDAPPPLRELAHWIRVLHRRALHVTVPVSFHRTSEPGRWVVAYPWQRSGQAEAIARAALRLLDESGGAEPTARLLQRISEAGGRTPEWVTDAERVVPVISISGTNGKSTTTRMIAHVALLAGRSVGATTTDGVIVDERLVEPGDYTGPQGARTVLRRPGVELAVLETARGGILLRGLGYQSNDVSVLTNISADHLDLQGVHTLPELTEVKSVICRVTRPGGVVVLNADDPLVAGVARHVRSTVYLFSLSGRGARLARYVGHGGRAFVVEDGWIVERTGVGTARIVAVANLPATLGGLARHNVANALAATAGSRALGFSTDQVAAGLRDFLNTADLMPGRLNLYVRGDELAIIDYAHNEAGLAALLDTAEGLIGKRDGRRATMTVVIGTAGDRPDDSLRAIGRLAAQHGDRVVIKESLTLLRGRTRAELIGELLAGVREAGASASDVPVYTDELEALKAELGAVDRRPHVIIEMCHELRPQVRDHLTRTGFTEVLDLRVLGGFRT